MKATENNSIDFAPVKIEDASQTESPAEHAARMERLDDVYTVSSQEFWGGRRLLNSIKARRASRANDSLF